MRSKLSTFRAPSVQRAYAIKRRKEIWDLRHPELSAESADNRKGPGRPVSFAKDTQEKTGTPDRTTREHLSRAEALGDDLLEVTGTSPIPSALRLVKLSNRSCKAASGVLLLKWWKIFHL